VYMKETNNIVVFTTNLVLWHNNDNLRIMPWKGEKNPYKIWLSEIILQQTRVEQGLEYYNRFIIKYPTIQKLALAPEDEVFKLWEGLGYYSRCKNLIATARFIAFELAGKFPTDYESILKLKGIGPYTAAAIVSFAYNLPNAVVDGNVLRVLARYFGKSIPTDSLEGKKYFATLAQTLLDKSAPALYNQAIMDFGATICKPKIPLCTSCPLKNNCKALKAKTVNELPVKAKKLIKKKRFFYYIIAEKADKIYVKKRTAKDIWQNLWEFILIEQPEKIPTETFLHAAVFKALAGKGVKVKSISPFYKQQLTHQTIEGIFIHVAVKNIIEADTYTLVDKKEMSKLAFPRFITNYFEDKNAVKL
jgi:A/G-specific adenine glycosylase